MIRSKFQFHHNDNECKRNSNATSHCCNIHFCSLQTRSIVQLPSLALPWLMSVPRSKSNVQTGSVSFSFWNEENAQNQGWLGLYLRHAHSRAANGAGGGQTNPCAVGRLSFLASRRRSTYFRSHEKMVKSEAILLLQQGRIPLPSSRILLAMSGYHDSNLGRL